MIFCKVSIPSNGSIQFLRLIRYYYYYLLDIQSQSPQTGQFNSYAIGLIINLSNLQTKSQSPQTGQFNSYLADINKIRRKLFGLNPLKRVNSILTTRLGIHQENGEKSQSPQTGQFNSYGDFKWGLANSNFIVSIPSNGSIQFLQFSPIEGEEDYWLSQSPQTGQFNSYAQDASICQDVRI